MDPRDADHRDLKLASDGARVMIASGICLHKMPIISPEEGATWGTITVQWRHPVMMMMTSLNDRS